LAASEDDFAQSLSMLEEVRFQHSFVFKYSVREARRHRAGLTDVPE